MSPEMQIIISKYLFGGGILGLILSSILIIIILYLVNSKLQEQRIRETYPDNFQQHLDNINHASETEMNTIDISKFDIVINVDKYSNDVEEIVNKIINFISLPYIA